MAKDKDLLSRFGANLKESMGAGRVPGVPEPSNAPAAAQGPSRHDGCTRLRSAAEIEVDRIGPDWSQPRTEFDQDSLKRLADSFRTHGQLQPISVRWNEAAGRYVIVTGERRWRAAVQAGSPTIAAVVIEGERTDSQILEMQLIENALREDLKPVEQAKAFRTLMDRNSWPALRLAEVLHVNISSVTRALSLLDLPAPVQGQVEAGELAPSVAYEISKAPSPTVQTALAARVVNEGLNRAETVAEVRKAVAKTTSAKPNATEPAMTERTFKTASAKVSVELRKGSGRAAIRAALAEALAIIDGELENQEQAA